ncbi:MAG: hypothetical protein Q9182_001658 [Xanthomendoza sp. 2 TL-2023]
MDFATLVPFVLAAAASVPMASRLYRSTKTRRRSRESTSFYEDDDGAATPTSRHGHPALTPTLVIIFTAINGFAISISAVITDRTFYRASTPDSEKLVASTLWMLLVAQSLSILYQRRLTEKFLLGIWAAVTALIILGFLTIVTYKLIRNNPVIADNTQLIFAIAQLVACVLIVPPLLSLRRRPPIYHHGKPVDEEYTASVLGRSTFSWAGPTLTTAGSESSFGLGDLPTVSHYMRSRFLLARWSRSNSKTRHLVDQIFCLFQWALVRQVSLTIIANVTQFGPQYAMYRLLLLLEQRSRGSQITATAWLWVAGLALCMFFNSIAQSWLAWIGWSQIAIPLRALLSDLVFRKSLQRKDVKSVQGAVSMVSADEAPGIEPAVNDVLGPIEEPTRPPEENAIEEDVSKMTGSVPKPHQSTSNLVAVDSFRISDFVSLCWFFPASIMRLLLSLWFLYTLIGWASLLAGILAWSITLPINAFVSKRYSGLQGNLMKARDQRMVVITEVLQSIRQIKFAGQEDLWRARISEERKQELAIQWRAFLFEAGLFCLLIAGPVLLSTFSLATYVYLNGNLLPSIAFTTIAVLGDLQFILTIIPQLITHAIDAWVSVRRIEGYLNAAERTPCTQEADNIHFQDASIAWPSDSQQAEGNQFVLKNINLKFPPKELSVISGQTGSGKSLLLAAIVGEVDKLAGIIAVPQAPNQDERFDSKATQGNWIIDSMTAFVAQTPWIEPTTIRNNILFGLPLDWKRYQQTITVCALAKDFESFTDGDLTDIGSKGVNLSGGQRCRISFARALYSRAGILVLDDILSALDTQVGRQILEKALASNLGVGRTRILVTHHLDLCRSKSAYHVVLGNRTVEFAGDPNDLAHGPRLKGMARYMTTEPRELSEAQLSEEPPAGHDTSPDPLGYLEISQHEDIARGTGEKFTKDEKKETGGYRHGLYKEYIVSADGLSLWILAFTCFLGGIALDITRTWWLSVWTRADHAKSISRHYLLYAQPTQRFQELDVDTNRQSNDVWFYITIYVALSGLLVILGTAKHIWAYTASVRASRLIFNNAVDRILSVPLRWLDAVPVGRILNRFTADFNILDSRFVNDLCETLYALLELIGISIAGFMVSPFMIVFAGVSVVVGALVGSKYLRGAREVKRLEAIARSPILELFDHVQAGLVTIRAFGKVDEFNDRMQSKIDIYTTAFMHTRLFNQWMSLRLNLIAASFTVFLASLILLVDGIDASLAGFALAFGLRYNLSLIWTIQSYASVEMDMNSVERIMEYTHLETEPGGDDIAPTDWPSQGNLEVNGLVAAYSPELPPVLRGISFTAAAGERVGIVGRTGAGKSSLTLALFRFLEASQGSIVIDGVDIARLRVHDLRSRLSIIPQDPVLFSGTVRSNVDPESQHTDDEVRAALAKVFVRSTANHHTCVDDDEDRATPESSLNVGAAKMSASTMNHAQTFPPLASPISSGGLNFSLGERQLLCLARAILARPKILILDEATSSVDKETDTLIQRSLDREFRETTLIVIAHRLSTVAGFEQILVMSDGEIVERGTAAELMEMKGLWKDMVVGGGG